MVHQCSSENRMCTPDSLGLKHAKLGIYKYHSGSLLVQGNIFSFYTQKQTNKPFDVIPHREKTTRLIFQSFFGSSSQLLAG